MAETGLEDRRPGWLLLSVITFVLSVPLLMVSAFFVFLFMLPSMMQEEVLGGIVQNILVSPVDVLMGDLSETYAALETLWGRMMLFVTLFWFIFLFLVTFLNVGTESDGCV